MKIKTIKRIGIAFLSVVLLGGSLAWAAEITQAAGMAMPLMFEGGTARAMSMGSAVVGMPQGSASLFWNPAGLGAYDECMELGVHHNSGLGDTIQETAVIGVHMGALGGFAASLNYVNNGSFQGRDSAGNLTSDYTAGNMGASVGWGKQWLPRLSAGIAVKYNKQTLASTSYNAYAADLGLLWNAFSGFNLGATYSNLGSKVAESVLDSGWRVGASYAVDENVLLAASSELKNNGFDRVQAGVEDWVHPKLAVRVGYVHNVTDSKLEDLTGLTAGLGVKITEYVVFDYAYVPSGELGISQRLSLTYKFACKAKYVEPAKVAEVKPAPVEKPNVVVLEKLIMLEDTQFDFDSAALNAQGAKVVSENAQILKENPGAKIRVAGYSSCSGTADYNQKLSERRAKSVEAMLIKEGGITQDRITTIGYGATRPAEFEPYCNIIDSKAAKANMRVLFEIITK